MRARLVLLALALVVLAAPPAQAGVSTGDTGPENTISNCSAGWTTVPFTGGNYQTAAGIVTKWFTQAGAGSGRDVDS